MGLVAATVAAVIREDHAVTLAREGIDQRPLAHVPDGVRRPVVHDHRGAITALVFEVTPAPSWPFAA